jgi:hypothetical protein
MSFTSDGRISAARYNAVGRFGRISEVATRIAGQLSGEGNSAAFREFAWRFVNIIARALVELGQRPDYLLIQRHVINIDALFIEYAQHYFAKNEPKAWEVVVQLEAKLNDKNIPRNMIGREKRVIALEQYLSQVRIYDPVLDGLRSAVRYDRTYFDKIVASLLPLLEKLTTGKIAQLLAPNYSDLERPTPDLRLDADHQEAGRGLCRPRCTVGRGSRGGGRQFDVLRSRIRRGSHLQVRHRRRPAGCRDGHQGAHQRPCRRVQRTHGRRVHTRWSTRAAAQASRSRPTRRPSRTSRRASATARRRARSWATSTTCSCCACARPPRPNC